MFALADDWSGGEDKDALNADAYGMTQLIDEIRAAIPGSEAAVEPITDRW